MPDTKIEDEFAIDNTPKTDDVKTDVKTEGEQPKKGSSTTAASSTTAPKKEKPAFVLKNTAGKEVNNDDYFYSSTDKKYAPMENLKNVIGKPVEREDLIELFEQIFKPSLGFLFYKKIDTEVYIVIIPIKNSTTIGREHESMDGDFQKHAISVIAEGSVNIDSFKAKLKRIIPFVKISE